MRCFVGGNAVFAVVWRADVGREALVRHPRLRFRMSNAIPARGEEAGGEL